MQISKNGSIPAIAVGIFLAHISSASAAILAVGDQGSWVSGGDNTLSNLGLNLLSVADDQTVPELATVTGVSSPLGNITFSPDLTKRYVGSTWYTWSHGYTGDIYNLFNQNNEIINLPTAIGAFDLFVEPTTQSFYNIVITAFASNGDQVSLSQSVNGFAGAKYFGFYTTGTDTISEIEINSDPDASGFAIGEFRIGEAVPEPATIIGSLMGLGVLTQIRRKSQSRT